MDVEIDYSQAYKSNGNNKTTTDNGNDHPGWDNPNNPHYPGDVQVPFDGGVWFLVAIAIGYFLMKIRSGKKNN